MTPVSFAETEIKIDNQTGKKYLLNRWWTSEELAEEVEKITRKESRYSASGRNKILAAHSK